MEANDTDKATKIEQLGTFPFKSFQEYKKASFEGVAQPTVDRSVALQWAQNGIHAPKSLRFQTSFLMMLPFLSLLGFIIFTIVTQNWWYLLTIPVFIICYFVFHPSFGMLLKPVRNLFIGLTVIGFFWAAWSSKGGLLAMTISLLVIWFAQNRIYRSAVNGLIEAANNHEDFFCKLWEGKILSIRFYNGDTHSVAHKFENGNYTSYKK